MDRLTERDVSFDGTSCTQIKASNSLCSEICREHKAGCKGCPIETALERLAQYEDIGLTPEQLLQVDAMYTDRCREIAELERRKGSLKKKCVDEYGNPVEGLKIGAVVESDLAIFTVGKINEKTRDWLVVMDKDKPYKIKDESNPMSKCVKSGYYAVVASCLVFSEIAEE